MASGLKPGRRSSPLGRGTAKLKIMSLESRPVRFELRFSIISRLSVEGQGLESLVARVGRGE